jgi:hypothetical protein
MKYRGNLTEGKATAGSGDKRPPAGAEGLTGGEVNVRDDVMRSKADQTKTPAFSGKSKFKSLPGKEITGRRGAGKGSKRKFTAKEAAAILGKRC